jgi:glyoxylase-like metal-dependent hydrolase (beta-lactamase superfamily II)
MEILPDVHLIAGRASNLYLCIDEDGLTLIDAGMPGDQQVLFGYLESLGRQPGNIRRILITHADIDHCGGLAAIQAASDARVFAGRQTCELLLTGQSPRHMPSVIQWFTDRFMRTKPISRACLQTIEDGDVLPVLGGTQALASPGHTPEHFSFYCQNTDILFAGDALNTRGGWLQRSPRWLTADQGAADRSAIRLLELKPGVLACGHGQPLHDHEMSTLSRLFK